MIADVAKEKLEQLSQRLDEGSVHRFTRKTGYRKVSVLGDKTGASPLPTLTGTLRGIDLNLEFSPYPEGGYMLSIEMKVDSPFKLVLTLEDYEAKSMKFRSTGIIPVSEIEIDRKEFDDRYFIETLEAEAVRKFLHKDEVRELIVSLGTFDRYAFQYRYMKILYYVEDLEKLDVDWVYNVLDTLAKIGEKLK